VSRTGLAAIGGALGAGVLMALAAGACLVAESAAVVRRLAAESAGQCGPCVNGLPAIAAVVTALAAGTAAAGDVERLRRWCGMVERRGACGHPDEVVRFVRSLLAAAPADVEAHVQGGCGRPFRALLPLGELA
jgi:NADH:ubiquinone oxidoreductase subunit F (NADH-binding)